MAKLNLRCLTLGQLDPQIEKKVLKSVGSDFWKKIKKSATRAWRIRQDGAAQLCGGKQVGIFFSAETYVVIHTPKEDDTQVFVWVGLDASHVQYEAACYLALRANQQLPYAVLHREVMGRESLAFLQAFPGFMVLSGTQDSSLNTKKPKAYKPRFFRVQIKELQRGRRCAISREIAKDTSGLNVSDSFLLDEGLNIMLWHGRNTTPRDKILAQGVTQRLADERGGKPSREFLDQGIDNETEFFKKLGSPWYDVDTPAAKPEQTIPQGVSRLLQVTLVPEPKLQELAIGDRVQDSMLHSTEMFLLDDGYGVAVWFGQGVDIALRVNALNCAVHYLLENNRALDTPILSVVQGREPKVFFEYFPSKGNASTKTSACFDTSPGFRQPLKDESLQRLLAKQASKASVTSPEQLFESLESKMRSQADSDDEPDALDAQVDAAMEEGGQEQQHTSQAQQHQQNRPQEQYAASKPEQNDVPAPQSAQPATEAQPQTEQAKPPVATNQASTIDAGQPVSAQGEQQPQQKQQQPQAEAAQSPPPIPARTRSAPALPSSETFLHPAAKKGEAETMLNGKPDGTFLLRLHPVGYILSVVYKGVPTHHLVDLDQASGVLSINKQLTGQRTLDGLLKLLSSKQPWWPVPLREGVPNGAQPVQPPPGPQPVGATAAPATKQTALSLSQGLPYFHHGISKQQAEAKVAGRPDGAFLLRPYTSPAMVVLTVVYQSQPTHHAVQLRGGTFKVNQQLETGATTIEQVISFLGTKRKGWPVPLTQAVV